MKLKSFLKKVSFILIFTFAFVSLLSVAKADYKNKITTDEFPSTLNVTLCGDGVVKSDGWQIYNKHTSSNYAMCTAWSRENDPKICGNGKTYKCTAKSKWSKAVSSGVGAIIKAGAGSDEKMTPTEYARTEFAINTYLLKAEKGAYKNSAMRDFSSISAVKSLVKIGQEAEKEYNRFQKSKLSLKVSNLKCSGNTCRLKYEIKGKSIKKDLSKLNISIAVKSSTSSTGNTVTNPTGPTGTAEFTISTSEQSTLTITATLKKNSYFAQDYDCGKNQSITPNIIRKDDKEITLKATRYSGYKAAPNETVIRYFNDSATCNVLFEKVSSVDGEPLSGAKFDFRWNDAGPDFDTLELEDSFAATASVPSDSEDKNIANKKCVMLLSSGTSANFTYRESQAPLGYVLDNTEKTGTFPGSDADQTVITIENKPNTRLTVEKIDGDTKQPLGGATLSIEKDGEPLQFRYTNQELTEAVIIDGTGTADGQTSWDSSKTITFIGLDFDEQYDIVETKAPNGYVINNPSTAVVIENTATTPGEAVTKTVTIPNYKTVVKLSKQDVTTGKEIPGASLKVIDGQGNVYDEWISSTTPHEINSLEDGTYYLQETIAPKGYELNTTTVEFVVENGKTKSSLVVMNDSPTKLTIANTLLGKGIITYIIGGILMLGGAGVLGYELKKRKVLSK